MGRYEDTWTKKILLPKFVAWEILCARMRVCGCVLNSISGIFSFLLKRFCSGIFFFCTMSLWGMVLCVFLFCRRRHKSDCLCAICVLKRRRREREENARIAKSQTEGGDNNLSPEFKLEVSLKILAESYPNFLLWIFVMNSCYKLYENLKIFEELA